MEISALQVWNEFALVALAVALGYLVVVWLVMNGLRLIMRSRSSGLSVCRPGEIVHQALKVSGRHWDHYRTAALMFSVSLLLLMNFGRYGLWAPKPIFVNIVMLICLLPPIVFGLLKLVQLARYRFRLSKQLELHDQMAQRLVEVQLRGNRVYPSVRLGSGLLDNVVVGRNGVYTVQLFTPPPGAESVKYDRGALVFQPGNIRVSMNEYHNAITSLSSLLGEQVGSPVQVLPVVVVPDCRIEQTESLGPLLLSLQACASFVSWQDNEFFLLENDLAQICAWLGNQKLEEVPHTLTSVVDSLERQIQWPALGWMRREKA